jgi:hypothetical protein
MSRALSDLKDRLNLKIHDKTNGTIEDADSTTIFNNAIDKLKSFHEFPGTKQRADLDVFESVFEYSIPSGYKSMIDIRIDDNRTEFRMRSAKDFWHDKQYESNIHADDNYNETKILLVDRKTAKGNLLIHDCDSLTANGTWAAVAATDVVNITLDEAEKKTGSAALNFDLDVSNGAGNTGALQNSTITSAIDMEAHEDKSTLFCWVYVPDVTNISSFDLRWGSDTTNYWEVNVTTAFNGQAFRVGWNRLGFAWDGATETGTPVVTAIDMIRFTENHGASQGDDTDFRLDDIRSILPERITVSYYSNNFAQSSANVYQTEFLANDDTTILEDHQDQLLLKLAEEEAFEILREFDEAAKSRNMFNEMFTQIAKDKPSEEDKITGIYYHFPG